MLLSAFNSKKFPRYAGAIQVAIVFCCTVQPASAQSTTNAVAKTSTILIDTDDACRLNVDGSDEGVVTPDEVTKIKVRPGGHILKCSIEKAPDLVWRTVIETKSGEQAAALISLKALHTQHSQAIPQAAAPTTPAGRSSGDPTARSTSNSAARSEETRTGERGGAAKKYGGARPAKVICGPAGHPLGTRRCQIPGQAFLETHYTDVITFTSLRKDSIKAHITKLTRASGDNWQSDFSMTFLVRGPNQFVQDGTTSCLQRLHNGKPDKSLSCSMWTNQMPLDLQFAVIDPTHIQVTSGQWFNGDKKNFTFEKSLE